MSYLEEVLTEEILARRPSNLREGAKVALRYGYRYLGMKIGDIPLPFMRYDLGFLFDGEHRLGTFTFHVKDGNFHRVDGPAIEGSGYGAWYVNGQLLGSFHVDRERAGPNTSTRWYTDMNWFLIAVVVQSLFSLWLILELWGTMMQYRRLERIARFQVLLLGSFKAELDKLGIHHVPLNPEDIPEDILKELVERGAFRETDPK